MNLGFVKRISAAPRTLSTGRPNRPHQRLSRRSLALWILPLLLLLALPSAAQAQFTYTTNNGAITITGYSGPGGGVDIPSTINGLPVTSIGAGAFYSCASLTSITIPKSVTSIGDMAFAACTNLAAFTVDATNSIYSSMGGVLFNKSQTTLIRFPEGKAGTYIVPNNVTSIGAGAFYYCDSLTSLTISNSITNIGEWAFAYCTRLPFITISDNVTSIPRYAFYACTSFTAVSIPASVTSIGDSAFGNCASLTAITIPASVASIGIVAFGNCTSLSSVTIPGSVTNIGNPAFVYCTNLAAITVDATNSMYSSVGGILFTKSQTALIQCPAGKAGSYTVPNSVTSIGDWAFVYCSSLTSVSIGNNVTNIGARAFSNCASLTTVTIPAGVTSIGEFAFYYCTSLAAITVDATNSIYSSVDGVLLNKSRTTLIQCPAGKAGSYTVPNSVTSLGDYAFYYCSSLASVMIGNGVRSIGSFGFFSCTSLTNITIGNSVTNIPSYAFSSCTSLTNVTIPSSVASIGYYAFAYCTNLTGVYFQGAPPTVASQVFSGDDQATVYYSPGTTGWGTTFGGRPTAPSSSLAFGAEWAFEILHEFSNTDGGPSEPWELIQTRDGDFFASSMSGGSSHAGTIFRLDRDGGVTLLMSLGGTNGDYPQEGLIEGADGNFYGTTYQAGGQANGAIFKFTPAGLFTNLHRFRCLEGEGGGPICRLAQTPDGDLYGTTFYGGASGCMGNSAGTVFKIATNGVFTTVLSFDRTNGANPQCGLVLGGDGALYGSTTGGGGPSGDAYGTIFRLSTNGVLTTLQTFNYSTDGSLPSGNLLQASDGNFYGTTEYGINNDFGTVFRMTPGGALTTLVNLTGINGSYPHGDLVQAGDGCIYGRTIVGGKYDYGTLFRLTTNGVFTTVLDFDGTNGTGPWAAMLLGRDGNLYGTTAIGGTHDAGVAFRLAFPPRITDIGCSNGLATVTWTSLIRRVYRVEQNTSLVGTNWTPVSADIIATSSTAVFSLPADTNRQGFYRVMLRPLNQ